MSKKSKKLDYLVASAEWQNNLLYNMYNNDRTGNPDPTPPPPPPDK